MNKVFKKIIKGNRLGQDELKELSTQIELTRTGLNSVSSVNVMHLTPSFSKLLLYGMQSAENNQQVLEALDWLENSEKDINFSEDLETLVSLLFYDFQIKRISAILEKINDQKSLTPTIDTEKIVVSFSEKASSILYSNKVDSLNIDFGVYSLPFNLEVLDPRVVVVKPGKANEMHRHAHETVFIFLKGKGKVVVDRYENEVEPGQFALIPRWCSHQMINLGHEDLIFLAVADFGLTGKTFMGDYTKTARLKQL